jgi:thiol:disulfide interchange protein DsbC
MKNKVFRWQVCTGLATWLALAIAVSPAWADDDTKDEFSKIISKIIPGARVESAEPVELPQLYEVVLGSEVVYLSKDGRYLIEGDLIDLEQKKNLTEDRRADGRKKIIDAVDESTMIVFKPEKPKHTVTVFTDIDCPYCRKMHQQMEAYNELGIAIRYLAFPRAGIGSKSYDKAVAAWCARDRQAALTAAKAGEPVESDTENCDNPVDGHLALSRKLGLTGTPALIFEDGTLVPGYLPPARLLPILGQM